MKFIFPKNYNFKNKLFGFIDYTTVVLNIVLALFVFCILDFIFNSINLILSLFIIIYFPILLFSIFNLSNENILIIIIYFCKFIKNRKVYFFSKSNN